MTFCWTIWPISAPWPSWTMIFDFMNLAGRVSTRSTLPWTSTTWSLWVRNWSTEDSMRSAFLAVDWPTWRTAPIWRPFWSWIAYSLMTSMSLAVWLTTSTGSVKIVPPPCASVPAPTLATSATIFSTDRDAAGTAAVPWTGSIAWTPFEDTWSVQPDPSQ